MVPGSYGAWLLEPYSDRAGWMGQNTFNIDSLKAIADFAGTTIFSYVYMQLGIVQIEKRSICLQNRYRKIKTRIIAGG
jgi:hypothetical protein